MFFKDILINFSAPDLRQSECLPGVSGELEAQVKRPTGCSFLLTTEPGCGDPLSPME
jgi:hypothetical protein